MTSVKSTEGREIQMALHKGERRFQPFMYQRQADSKVGSASPYTSCHLRRKCPRMEVCFQATSPGWPTLTPSFCFERGLLPLEPFPAQSSSS